VAQLALYQALWERADPHAKVTPVLVARSAPAAVRELLTQIGGTLVEVPPGLLPPADVPTGLTPLTTEKAWKVFTTLLRLRVARGVRPLGQESGVSAGWVHRTVNELVARGIAQKGEEGIVLADPRKILDVVAFERPLKSIQTEIIPTDYVNAHEAAVEITRILSRPRADLGPIAFGFGGHTAAGLYTGYAHRQDRVDLYIDDPDFRPYVAGAGTEHGVRIHVLKPDRGIAAGSETVDDVRLVSRDLALLDVAGLGYAARDVALKLLESYGDRKRS
jgi:hypothetical protein